MGTIAKEKPEAGTETTQAAAAFENAIILRPIQMDVGRITTNAEAVLKAVQAKAAEYKDLSRYEGDGQAKKDRALLRKQLDAMKTADASLMEAWNEPLKAYRGLVAQIKGEMTGAIDTIDAFVKEGEAREKERKLDEIRAYFDSRNFDLVPFGRIVSGQWTNKTCKMADVKKEIDAKIAEVHANLKILENIPEYGQLVKAVYLERLDMGAAMREVETLKANAERAAREKRERAEREARETVARNAEAEIAEARKAEKEARVENMVAEILGGEPAEAGPTVYWFEFRIEVTEEQARELKTFMTGKNIAYDKLGQGVVE